jgi:peptidoglycan/xylan/chitin deacetylase (PgdA/CDA1 family)
MQRVQVSILVYHRFAPVSTNDMTVTTPVFESQMKQLVENGYKVIRLDQLVAYLSGNAAATPACSAVITADDGHRSIYTDMAPIVERYGIPVTLFVYPSAISNAVWAMTWDDLRELQGTGLFDIQSHTFWHPNFPHESKHLDFAAYQRFVDFQLTRSKAILQERLRTRVDMLAWPFGIYDDWLMARAQEAGYVAGFTLGRLAATGHDRLMALPRFLVTNQDHGRAFERLLDCDMRK